MKFIHPQLIAKLEENGYSAGTKKFYVKPLSDDVNCEIGFGTGKSSPWFQVPFFSKPNSVDLSDETAAWANREGDYSLDNLLKSIKDYLITPGNIGKNTLNTFLFAWNPSRWDWIDLQASIDQRESVGYVERRWNCGNSKRIKKGG